MKNPTKLRVERLRDVVAKAYPYEDHTDLIVRMDWDWPGKPTPTIIWEGGPYDWSLECDAVRVAAEKMGLFVEAYSSWALCVYRGWS